MSDTPHDALLPQGPHTLLPLTLFLSYILNSTPLFTVISLLSIEYTQDFLIKKKNLLTPTLTVTLMITLSLTISAKMKCLRELVFSTLLRARDNSSLPMMPQPLTSGSRFSPSTKTAFNLSFSLEPLDTFQSLYYLNPSQYSALLSTPSLQKSFPLVSHTPHFLNFPSFSLVDFLIENC